MTTQCVMTTTWRYHNIVLYYYVVIAPATVRCWCWCQHVPACASTGINPFSTSKRCGTPSCKDHGGHRNVTAAAGESFTCSGPTVLTVHDGDSLNARTDESCCTTSQEGVGGGVQQSNRDHEMCV